MINCRWGLAGRRPVVWVEDAEVGASRVSLLIWMHQLCTIGGWPATFSWCGLESLRG